MSFDLRLRFIGLALYVPEGKAAMHVLLPEARDHGGHPHEDVPSERGGIHAHETDVLMETERGTEAAAGGAPGADAAEDVNTGKHFARIAYDMTYEKPGQTQLSRVYRLLNITGRALELLKGVQVETAEELDVQLTDELPLMDKVAHPVPRTMVSGAPPAELAGRVTVNTGALTHVALGAAFHLEDETRADRMTPETEWTVRGITSRVPTGEGEATVPGLEEITLVGPGARKLPRLYPVRQTIELIVFNAVLPEFPPHGPFKIKNEDGDAEHFSAYYKICTPHAGTGVIPAKAETPLVDVKPREPGDEVPDEKGGQRPGVTCVHAQATLA